MTLRPYDDHDLDELLDVWHRASVLAHPFLSDDFLAKERGLIAQQWLPMAETTVYERDGKVVGFLSLVDNEIGGLFVDPDHQRCGIGHALMDGARNSRPYLELSVFERNSIGRQFYAAYGFKRVGRQVDTDTGQPELRLRLGRRTTTSGNVSTGINASTIDQHEE